MTPPLPCIALIFTCINSGSAQTVDMPAATASIVDAKGQAIGEAIFHQGLKGVVIDLTVKNLTPGKHGLHFHSVGKCDVGDAFKSAMHHMGATDGPHGFLNPQGPHAGDLPNLVVAADGTGAGEFYSQSVRLGASTEKNQENLLDADGSTLMIHEKEDNGIDQPSGGSGARVACGVIKVKP